MTRTRVSAALLALLVWLSCVWFGSWEWNPNQSTRLFAALSIVEQGDATIDEYAALTIDKARFDQHVYLDKAPGMTLMALPAVAVADAITGQRAHDLPRVLFDRSFERFLRLRLRLAVAISSGLLTALAALAIHDWGRALGGGGGAALFTALGFALGTPIWGWSTTLFGHAPVAALFVIAAWAIWRGTETRAPSRRLALLAGFALGWAVVIEYSAVIGAIAIGLWALWRLGPARLAMAWPAVIGGLAAGAVLVGYNLFAFGTPFRLGYQGVMGFDGMSEGLFGLTYPKPRVLFELLFGDRRGMIWVAPILLLGAIGLVRLVRAPATRDVGVLALVMVALIFLYNASYAYWDGGDSTGPRHAVPAIPFLALGLAPAWRAARTVFSKLAALALLGLSTAINLIIAASEIVSNGTRRFPLWSDVIAERFLNGRIRTLPSEWLGWNVWNTLYAYLALAAILLLASLALQRDRRRSR